MRMELGETLRGCEKTIQILCLVVSATVSNWHLHLALIGHYCISHSACRRTRYGKQIEGFQFITPRHIASPIVVNIANRSRPAFANNPRYPGIPP